MVTFIISLLALIVGYLVYGKFVERVLGPDPERQTPAVAHPDGVDFIAMPWWKIFMIQFLNIAGTGPIFGAIMGAKFGPSAYLWIVFGCIFAGATHDYLSGMLSLRHDGEGLPELIGRYLGKATRNVVLVFTVLLLVLVGAVFVYSPATILTIFGGSMTMWFVIIFLYYLLATLLPIDKVIGRIYPVFAFSLLFMAVGLFVVLLVKWPSLPELWNGLGNMGAVHDPNWKDPIFPCLFITIACGAISGFHATQSPLMARCMTNEKQGRSIFYGAMITEGIVALIWATVSMYFFYGKPVPGIDEFAGSVGVNGMATSAPTVVKVICDSWLGRIGGVLAILGVVIAPLSTGDTALRSARLIVADFLHISQRPLMKRILVCVPVFIASLAMLLWQVGNPNGFNVVWQYFGWANQTLAVFTLWMLTVYLAREHKPYIITLVPALFMTTVSTTFIFVSPQALGLSSPLGYLLGLACFVIALVFFVLWKIRKCPRRA
jgi:carbon starvation protein CstA